MTNKIYLTIVDAPLTIEISRSLSIVDKYLKASKPILCKQGATVEELQRYVPEKYLQQFKKTLKTYKDACNKNREGN